MHTVSVRKVRYGHRRCRAFALGLRCFPGLSVSLDDVDAVASQRRRVILAQGGLILDDRFERDTALGIFFRSDQFPFILHDVPALWFFTGFHPDYHHVTDTVDKIDFNKMTKIVRLSYLTLFAIADEKQTPKFVANPALGK